MLWPDHGGCYSRLSDDVPVPVVTAVHVSGIDSLLGLLPRKIRHLPSADKLAPGQLAANASGMVLAVTLTLKGLIFQSFWAQRPYYEAFGLC